MCQCISVKSIVKLCKDTVKVCKDWNYLPLLVSKLNVSNSAHSIIGAPPMKYCKKCSTSKPTSLFSKDKSKKDGLSCRCKACRGEYRAANKEATRLYNMYYQASNKEVLIEKRAAYREANEEDMVIKSKAYRVANKEHIRSYSSSYAKAHLAQRRATCAKVRACKLNATPSWADHRLINLIYAMAAGCTEIRGEKYHVDHIVPLQGDLVCGLHTHENLRVITATENLSKSNKFIS